MSNPNYKKIDQNKMTKKFKNIIFKDEKKTLLINLAKNPERFVGVFRVSKPRTKLIQNLTQSHEIKYGNAFEKLIEHIFISNGYESKPKVLKYNNENLDFDQLFEKNGEIIFIEQKIRDDHDSSKKRGQDDNFKKKIEALKNEYKDKKIKAYIYFIDPSFTKNKNYYKKQVLIYKIDEISENLKKDNIIKKIKQQNTCDLKNKEKKKKLEIIEKYINKIIKEKNIQCKVKYNLVYGKELFEKEGLTEAWDDIKDFLNNFNTSLPDLPELNFDKDAANTFKEIKDIPINDFKKLFENQDIIDEIFPIIFPKNEVLEKLNEYFKNQIKKYDDLLNNIDNFDEITSYNKYKEFLNDEQIEIDFMLHMANKKRKKINDLEEKEILNNIKEKKLDFENYFQDEKNKKKFFEILNKVFNEKEFKKHLKMYLKQKSKGYEKLNKMLSSILEGNK